MQSLRQEIFQERERHREREIGKRQRKKIGKEKKRVIAVEFIFHSVFQNTVVFLAHQCLLTEVKHFTDTLLGWPGNTCVRFQQTGFCNLE